MPLNGYTKLFEAMLDHNNITVRLNTDARRILEIGQADIKFEGQLFSGEVIYTGPIDELFQCRFGRLPYRSLKFEFENYKKEYFQSHGVINYTVSEDYTRITEFKRLTNQDSGGNTTIMKEYPIAYTGEDGQIPYYSIINSDNLKLYEDYTALTKKISKLYLLGRLAEYKYYNIDAIVAKALELAEKIK